MLRFAAVVAALTSSVTFVACDVGSVLANSSGDGGGSGSDESVCAAAATGMLIPTPHTHALGGSANTGSACVASGCHGDGSNGAPIFNYGGTVYNAGATAGAAGIGVLITLSGVTKQYVTDAEGNFYAEKGDPHALDAPTTTNQANTKVCNGTAAATPTPMAGSLGAAQGNCSASGTCHGTGGSEGKVHQ